MDVPSPDAPTVPAASEERLGLSSVTMAVVLMGIGSVVAKAADIEGPVLGFHRLWGAAVVYTAALLLAGGRLSMEKFKVAAPGGLTFGIQIVLFFSAIQLTSVANTTMILALQPVLVLAFFSKRFGETATLGEWVFAVIALGGIALMLFASADSPSRSIEGDLLAFATLVMWTLYFVFSKQARQKLGALEYQGLSLIMSSVVVLPVTLIFSRTLDPGPGKWWWVPLMVAIPGTGHLLLNWAHPRVPIIAVSELTLISPVVSVAVAALVLDGESVNLLQVLGMATVLVSLGLMLRLKHLSHAQI